MLELSIVVILSMVLAAISIPAVQSAVYNYRLRAAAASVSWAIQATRYQALMKGYPYSITFDSATKTYQLKSQPTGAAGFSNVGGAVPISGSQVTLTPTTTLECKPNGLVTATTGTLSLSVSYHGGTKTITVSRYGHVSITP